jgi:pimeloyl-ACP methyl ester carboxylesterase
MRARDANADRRDDRRMTAAAMPPACRQVDRIEAGRGPKVVLFHSSVSGARQWRSLMDTMASRHHLVAINLFGYGKTRCWDGDRPQTLRDQAMLMESLLPKDGSGVSIVGHSFGGSVAMRAAALFAGHVRKLVLVEPNPFYLLRSAGRSEAFREAGRLRDCVRENGRRGDWAAAAAVFADYWMGTGSWAAMPAERRAKFAESLQPNFHEWDAVMNETTPLTEWRAGLPSGTTVISAADTVRSIREIVELMQQGCPEWNFVDLPQGGHMAVLTRPDAVNPVIADALA